MALSVVQRRARLCVPGMLAGLAILVGACGLEAPPPESPSEQSQAPTSERRESPTTAPPPEASSEQYGAPPPEPQPEFERAVFRREFRARFRRASWYGYVQSLDPGRGLVVVTTSLPPNDILTKSRASEICLAVLGVEADVRPEAVGMKVKEGTKGANRDTIPLHHVEVLAQSNARLSACDLTGAPG